MQIKGDRDAPAGKRAIANTLLYRKSKITEPCWATGRYGGIRGRVWIGLKR